MLDEIPGQVEFCAPSDSHGFNTQPWLEPWILLKLSALLEAVNLDIVECIVIHRGQLQPGNYF